MILPWGLKRDETGRPDDPHTKKKLLMTTLLAAVLWGLAYMLIESDVISFREMALKL